MGKVFGAVLGKNRGKIGQVCYRVTKGQQFNGAMPVVNPHRQRTKKEVDNQARFALLGKLGGAFRIVSEIGLKPLMDKAYENAVSVFVKHNKGAVSVMGGEAEADYGSIKIAHGTTARAAFGNASFAEPLRISATYDTTADMPNANAQDKVYICAYQPDTNELMYTAQPELRNAGSITLRVPSTWTGLTVHVYGFVIGDGKDVNNRDITGIPSDSTYIGSGDIA